MEGCVRGLHLILVTAGSQGDGGEYISVGQRVTVWELGGEGQMLFFFVSFLFHGTQNEASTS